MTGVGAEAGGGWAVAGGRWRGRGRTYGAARTALARHTPIVGRGY